MTFANDFGWYEHTLRAQRQCAEDEARQREQRQRARRTVRTHAASPEQAKEILDMLGLTDDEAEEEEAGSEAVG